MAVLLAFVLLISAAFAVDLGSQRVVRRDMQALADLVALDLARQLDGRTRGALQGPMTAARDESVARNTDNAGDPPTVSFDLGTYDDGAFVAVPDAGVPDAVRVVADSGVDFVFGGLTGVERGEAVRSAVAQSVGGACFAIGSYAARLDTGASPLLGPLLGALGSNITLSAVDYNGLANARVKLVELLGAEVGALTTEEVLAGSRLVSLGDFYLAAADALDGQSTANVALLESIAASVGAAQLRVSDILGIATGTGHGLDADLNLLDLVTAAAAAATGEAGLSIPQANVNLGPLAGVTVGLEIIEPPKRGCGRKNHPDARATSSQVDLTLSSSLLDLNLGVGRTRVRLSGSVSLASASGQLTDVRCDPAGATVRVADGLLSIDLTLEVTVYALGIPVVGGPIRITGASDSSGDAVIEITSDADYDRPVTVHNNSSGLPNLTTRTSGVKLIGLPLGVVLSPILDGLVSGLVNPLVQGLDSALLTPLLRTLGLDLSGADVYLDRVPRCDAPKLVD
ncbi:hypothetical protein [Nocardioides sp. SYSU DS0651]|uniref:hypothetical protein n=1 Tax=Nocardioides sp. SYSU DS0651 TaxID=3415955 RepID=UPI003F4BCB1D